MFRILLLLLGENIFLTPFSLNIHADCIVLQFDSSSGFSGFHQTAPSSGLVHVQQEVQETSVLTAC